MSSSTLKFQPFSHIADPAFFSSLCNLKLNDLKLESHAVSMIGTYSHIHQKSFDSANSNNNSVSRFQLSHDAFSFTNSKKNTNNSSLENNSIDFSLLSPNQFVCQGLLYNANTHEEFKKYDKEAMFKSCADDVLESIKNGSLSHPSLLLNKFIFVSFADLKNYVFYHYFAIPALTVPGKIPQVLGAVEPVNPTVITNIISILKKKCKDQNLVSAAVFLVNSDSTDAAPLSEWDSFWNGTNSNNNSSTSSTSNNNNQSGIKTIGFFDPCGLSEHPGWVLRNLLILLSLRWKLTKVKIICLREPVGVIPSIQFTVEIPSVFDSNGKYIAKFDSTGWEKNSEGKVVAKKTNLSQFMDPKRLAADSATLNLKLMRWRLLPELDVDKVANCKCLLIGAGTLGCNVARMLLAWGVRKITFVDQGRVSFSNPVRQSLFTFEDSLNGGRMKADAAAKNLKTIFPSVESEGYVLGVAMPGHAVSTSSDDYAKKVKQDTEKLHDLIKSHDVIFLLTDTRESRWLPTMLAAAEGKAVINSALGFDCFVVMRHGITNGKQTPQLGCYFCNDVVAPQDSLTDRTLDQQCTVTRPGLSMMASAVAVELMVALLHHENTFSAPSDGDTALGLVPHQVRGFLHNHSETILVGHAYPKCTGCSSTITDAFKKDGWEFLLKVFNNPKYLEDVTGLTELHNNSNNPDTTWDKEGDEDDF